MTKQNDTALHAIDPAQPLRGRFFFGIVLCSLFVRKEVVILVRSHSDDRQDFRPSRCGKFFGVLFFERFLRAACFSFTRLPGNPGEKIRHAGFPIRTMCGKRQSYIYPGDLPRVWLEFSDVHSFSGLRYVFCADFCSC